MLHLFKALRHQEVARAGAGVVALVEGDLALEGRGEEGLVVVAMGGEAHEALIGLIAATGHRGGLARIEGDPRHEEIDAASRVTLAPNGSEGC